MFELTVEADFSSAHQLRGYQGNCERLHGHNWKVNLSVKAAQLNELGMVIDFKIVKQALRKVIEQLDHRLLNEHPDFIDRNPTCENLACWIFEHVKSLLQADGLAVSKITLWEASDSSCTYSEV